jgi:hypothetical protein
MIVYDDAQATYKGRKRPVWKQLGIEAAGYQWGQMAVLYPRHFIGERFEHCRSGVIGHCAECGNAKNIRCNALRLLHPTMLRTSKTTSA